MKKNKKGFTLVELVIVVAVMAVLIAVAIPTVSSITKTAQKTVADTNARTIESTLKLKEAELSKDGDTIVALTADTIKAALDAAKLGIEEGTYAYDPDTATVKAVYAEKYQDDGDLTETPAGDFNIEFNNGVVTATLVEAAEPADPDNP